MLSEVFVLAANVSYMGPFPPSYRAIFNTTLIEKLDEAGIKVTQPLILSFVFSSFESFSTLLLFEYILLF